MAWLYVPASVVSNLGSPLPSNLPATEPSVMWRGKPFPPQSWQRAWKKGGWIRRLSGTTFSPSMLSRGVAWWISSLADIHVNPSALLVDDADSTTPDISGHTSPESSPSANPLRCSWRMSEDISNSDSERSQKNFAEWVIALRQACLLRRKSARRIDESGSSFWRTATALSVDPAATYSRPGQAQLGIQAKGWPTPTAHDGRRPGPETGSTQGRNLKKETEIWGTPTTRDWKDGANPSDACPTKGLLSRQAPRSEIGGQPSLPDGQTSHPQWPTPRAEMDLGRHRGTEDTLHSATKKFDEPMRRKLNPIFVEWLMGWPLGWTDFVPVATESFRLWQHTHIELLRRLLRSS